MLGFSFLSRSHQTGIPHTCVRSTKKSILTFDSSSAMTPHPLVPFLLFAVAQGLKYADLESLGLACPERDRCEGYAHDLPFTERSCECDGDCGTYGDCCVDGAGRRTPASSPANLTTCLQYGENAHTGVYAVSGCGADWKGPKEVKEKCEGPADMSDPVGAAPVTSRSVTYKNVYCAECNGADADSLRVFQLKTSCDDLDGLSEERMMDKLSYDARKKTWGISGVDSSGNPVFRACQIIFDVPSYLKGSVRFCRANLVSRCARDWTRIQVRRSCEGYMAVVFDKVRAYRNPHCAICNHRDVQGLKCTTNLLEQGRFTPFPLNVLIDLNRETIDGPRCPPKHVHDPYFKRCRPLACALPGHVIRDGKCVPGG